jgi:intein/homing endonuclease
MTTLTHVPHGYGWRPSLPDMRDLLYTPPVRVKLPPSVSLMEKMPPVRDQGQLGACHDDKTEVLTDHGFKLFADLDGSEKLATVNPDTLEVLFEFPLRLVRFPYTGKVYCIDNQSLNFKVTPDHNMLVRKWDERKRTLDTVYQLTPIKDIGWYSGLVNRVVWNGDVQNSTYTLPGVPSQTRSEQRQPKDVPMKYWVRFLGIYLAEGTLLKRDQRKGKFSYKIQIAASKEREKVFVRETLAGIGVAALELKDRFTFSSRQVYEAVASLGLEGVKAGEKFVPKFIFHLGAAMIQEFLAGHFAGDGSFDVNRAHYTGSAKLASDLQALIFLSGNETRMSVRQKSAHVFADGRVANAYLPEHRVSVCEAKHLSIERKNSIFTEEYDGEVFCAEVPTYHTLVTRREGKVLVSGNCTAFGIGGTLEYEHLRQGLPDFHPSELFLYYEERRREHSIMSDAGADIRDGMKVLAKTGVCAEDLWPYDIRKFTVKPPQIAYDAARKDIVLQYQRVGQSAYHIKCALYAGHAVIFGFTVYESFENDTTSQSGIVEMPGEDEGVLGGHCMKICGYQDASQRFTCQNSWGSEWGASGYCTMPYDYLTDPQLAGDFWMIQLVQ